MTDKDAGSSDGAPPATLIECNQCGNDVPRMEFCIRCGNPLSDEYNAEASHVQRTRFAAAPDESALAVALYSTLFPQLPRTQMGTFRIALGAGVVIVTGLALLGFFPVALVAAAVLVPLLMVLYLWVVDIYEDEPLWVYGATMAWGVVSGIVAGVLLRGLPVGTSIGGQKLETVLIAGVAVPILEGVVMLLGPLLLLTQKRFNDVLDGATFGAASAVSFGGALLIVQSLPVFSAGLRPGTDPITGAVQIVSLAVLQPVIAAGAVGAVAAAFWLRYNAPVTDRHALGVIGVPFLAAIVGAALLVAAGLTKSLLPLIPATLILFVIAALALLWLRRTIHIGLLQESREIEVDRSIECPNCGRVTPEHTFCGNCGVALRALPKSRRAKAGPPASASAEEKG